MANHTEPSSWLQVSNEENSFGFYVYETRTIQIGKSADEEHIVGILTHEEIHRILHERLGLDVCDSFDKVCWKFMWSYDDEDYRGFLY